MSKTKEIGIYVKTPKNLKEHVNRYVRENNVKGGLSGLVRRFLIKKTEFEDNPTKERA